MSSPEENEGERPGDGVVPSHPHQRCASLISPVREQEIFLRSTASWREARAFLPAALRLCFALPSSLGPLLVTAASFSEDTCLLHTTAKRLHRTFKGAIRVDNTLTQQHYQRDRLRLEDAASRG